jgi:hypothetical protein
MKKIGPTMIYTKDYVREIDESHPYTAYGNFLDRLRYCKDNEIRQILIAERPDNDEKYPIEMAQLAASVEVLVKEYGLSMPEWVMDEKYILKEPFYDGVKNPEYKKLLKETAIPEFAKRNLFLGADCMSRA